MSSWADQVDDELPPPGFKAADAPADALAGQLATTAKVRQPAPLGHLAQHPDRMGSARTCKVVRRREAARQLSAVPCVLFQVEEVGVDAPDLSLKTEGLRERPEAEITTKTEV
jgi:hypothetical protein